MTGISSSELFIPVAILYNVIFPVDPTIVVPVFVVVGLLFLLNRLLFGTIIKTLKIDLSFLKVLLPSILKPILINGLICAGLGILMIGGYILINKFQKEKVA